MRNPGTFAFHRPRAVVVDRGRRDARRHGRVIFVSVIPRDLRSHGEREGDAARHEAMRAAIGGMDGSCGYDAVIVCTSNAAQEAYWQTRLEATCGQAAKTGATIVAVHEDWAADGAGNGLGTLYAYVKARAKAKANGGKDLDEILAKGGSVGMYHTAGKGTRLAPLPGSENNNKPGVKLPSLVQVNGRRKTSPFSRR